MYDDDVGEAGAGAGVGVLGPPHHWYDEPPYESDPEDFLIGKDAYRCVVFLPVCVCVGMFVRVCVADPACGNPAYCPSHLPGSPTAVACAWW